VITNDKSSFQNRQLDYTEVSTKKVMIIYKDTGSTARHNLSYILEH